MASGSEKQRYGMIRPGIVLNRLMSVQSLKIGAAIAIAGNVVIDRIRARIQNFPRSFRRASAYAQNDPTTSDNAVVTRLTIALLSSACVKSPFWRTDW